MLSGKPNVKRSLKGNSEIDAELPRVEPRLDGNFHGNFVFFGLQKFGNTRFWSIFCHRLMFVEMIFEKKSKTGSLSPKKIDLGTNTLGSLEV